MNEPWIRLENVRLSRGGRLVLNGITSELSGRAIGLVGANGAGKSTLIGALLGVLKPDSGAIRVLDLDLPGQAMQVRARAGVMAEQAGVFPGGSGVDAVVFAAMLSGLSRRQALRKAHRALDALIADPGSCYIEIASKGWGRCSLRESGCAAKQAH